MIKTIITTHAKEQKTKIVGFNHKKGIYLHECFREGSFKKNRLGGGGSCVMIATKSIQLQQYCCVLRLKYNNNTQLNTVPCTCYTVSHSGQNDNKKKEEDRNYNACTFVLCILSLLFY